MLSIGMRNFFPTTAIKLKIFYIKLYDYRNLIHIFILILDRCKKMLTKHTNNLSTFACFKSILKARAK